MTARDELIRQKIKRIAWIQDRIMFHLQTRRCLIDEVASIQAEIEAIRANASEDMEMWNYNEANEGQD